MATGYFPFCPIKSTVTSIESSAIISMWRRYYNCFLDALEISQLILP
jgi:hypothetical protein